jgi:hypothetical protein
MAFGDGLLRDLAVRITSADQIDDIYRTRDIAKSW